MQHAFDRFTEHARQAMTAAQEEARKFNHHFIGTEHILLGLLDIGECGALAMLHDLDVEPKRIRAQVENIVGRSNRAALGETGMTRRADKVIELAVDEAVRLNSRYTGTEHLLLGLIREGEGIASGVLESLGLNLEKVRRVATLGVRRAVPSEGGPKSNVVTCRLDDSALGALDALVEAGIRSTRSDAAAWLINAGIESHSALFTRLDTTIREIRQLRREAQDIARQVVSDAEGGAPHADEQAPDQQAEGENA